MASVGSRGNGSIPPPSVQCVHILFQNVLLHVGVTKDLSALGYEGGKQGREKRSCEGWSRGILDQQKRPIVTTYAKSLCSQLGMLSGRNLDSAL
jgi:hypothetical protein